MCKNIPVMAVTRYLVDGALPPAGTVCPQNFKPFTNPAGAEAATTGSAEVARVIRAINLPLIRLAA